MKILALDQSSTHTGYVVIEDGKILETGCINAPDLELNARIIEMMKDMVTLFRRVKPDHLVIEEIYGRAGRYNALKALSMVRGALVYVWWLHSFSYPIPIKCSEARAAVGIKGNAKKEEIIGDVNKKFKLKLTNEHIADAVVLAVNGYNRVSTPKPKRRLKKR